MTGRSEAVAAREPFDLPPLSLANRVGDLGGGDDQYLRYLEIGGRLRQAVIRTLPADWSFDGRRVLDFGAGAGRMLRHFAAEAEVAEFWGCDLDGPSVEWMKRHLEPPFVIFANDEEPPLAVDPGFFDLVVAVSVFTHLTTTWSSWLAELHRVLRPDGLLLATFMGKGMSKWVAGEPWDDRWVGMNVHRPGQAWDLGGPMVLHSPWWLRAHWGRGFAVEVLMEMGFGVTPSADYGGQGAVLLRRLDVDLTPGELERPSEDPREATALLHNRAQLMAEAAGLRGRIEELERR